METVELRTLLRPLRRWWWLILFAALLAAFSGLVYSLRQPAIYRSRTTLLVGSTISNPNPSGADIYLVQQLAQAYAEIAQREPLQRSTMDALAREWLPQYTVQVLPNSQIIEIQVFAEEPGPAREVAAMLAQQLILLGPAGREEKERQQFVDSELADLQTAIVDTREEIQQKQQELANLFSAREIANAQNLITALQSKLSTLQANYAALLATTQHGAANTLNILEPANLPNTPMDSNLLTNLLIATMLGCVVAAGGAYLIEFLDDTLKSAEEVHEVIKVPLLTSVPLIANRNDESSRVIMLQNTPMAAMEAYRLLRVNLEFMAIAHPFQVLVVAGASPKDGKSLTTANLAAAYARAGKQVILLDADLHQPDQQRLFKVSNNMGVTTALRSDEHVVESLLHATVLPNLRLLTTGPLPPNPAELLSSKRMTALLNQLKAIAELVIIDSPPLTIVTDGMVLGMQADAMVLVVRSGKTRRANVKQVRLLLNQVQASLLGFIYNGVPAANLLHHAGYGYYGYRKEPTQPPVAAAPIPEKAPPPEAPPAPEPAPYIVKPPANGFLQRHPLRRK
jgi:non-specific protein-tyrosine kinase